MLKAIPHLILIDADYAGQRLDNFLFRELSTIPKSRIYRALRKGEVRVNKGRVKENYRLKEGDSVRLPPLVAASKEAVPQYIADKLGESLQDKVLYENDHLLILNKPAGMAVHGGSGIQAGVIEALRQSYDQKNLELVHRLDRETSGCLLIAKKYSVLRQLHQLWRERAVEKTYLALVKGRWPERLKEVNLPLRKFVLVSGERMVKVDEENGQEALTLFKPLKHYPEATLLKVQLTTGRTHQIRVHTASMGYPVIGDDKYGKQQFNSIMQGMGCSQMFLHAMALRFQSPIDQQTIFVEAPLPQGLQDFLDKLGKEAC